jgi:hypothetical protein
MNGVVFQARERTRGNVTAPMMLWAIVMAAVLFLYEARYGSRSTVTWVGVLATVMLGVYLGWRRRVAAVLIAPLVSWLFAWFPLWVAAMIHDGVLRGLFAGLFLITVGWIGIGLVEMVWLAVVALLVRMLRGRHGRSEPSVVIYGPDK